MSLAIVDETVQGEVAERQSLTDIAAALKRDCAAFEAIAFEGVARAIHIGELLMDAKRLVRQGEWMEWLDSNFPLVYSQANLFIRFAKNKDALCPDGVPMSYNQAVAYLQGLAGPSVKRRREMCDEARRLGRKEKVPANEIAEILGVTEATVKGWVELSHWERKEKRLEASRRRVDARLALQAQMREEERQARIRAARKAGRQALAKASSLTRQALSALDAAHGEAQTDAERLAIGRAIHSLHRGEDEIKGALGHAHGSEVADAA